LSTAMEDDLEENGDPEGSGELDTGTIWSWWMALHDREDEGPSGGGFPFTRQSGTRAALTRCEQLADVYLLQPFWELQMRLDAGGDTQVACIAGVLAHVRDDNREWRLGAQMARDETVKPNRFERLLEAEDREELFRPMIRVVQTMDRTASIEELAESIFYWSDTVRKRWAEHYWTTWMDETRT